MTEVLPPPALSTMPQFTTAWWDKAPREMNKSKLVRTTQKLVEGEDSYTEFVFENGNAFLRKNSDLDPELFQKLHANLQVFVQTYQGELVTGLFIPEQGWVFKMTSQDLVDFAQKTVNDVNMKRQQAKTQLVDFLTNALLVALAAQADVESYGEGTVTITGPVDPTELATRIVHALEHAKAGPNG